MDCRLTEAENEEITRLRLENLKLNSENKYIKERYFRAIKQILDIKPILNEVNNFTEYGPNE